MFNRILGRSRDVNHPRVMRAPQHVTTTFFYRYGLYIPQPTLLSANGLATPMNIRTSTAAGGTLVLGKDQNGYPRYSVIYPNTPVDR